MIPEEHKAAIITSGISFMRSITECYGSEDGMKLWDAIIDTIDPSVKGEIFFAMLRGDYQNSIVLKGVGLNTQKIPAIKEIRAISGLGLHEAKTAYEDAERGYGVTISCDPKKVHDAIFHLRAVGMIV